MIGLLNFACAVVKPGRAFLRRIIDLTLGLKRPTHRRWLTKEARTDLKAWSLFIENFNGKSFFLSDIWENSEQLHVYTDASDLGFEVLCQKMVLRPMASVMITIPYYNSRTFSYCSSNSFVGSSYTK